MLQSTLLQLLNTSVKMYLSTQVPKYWKCTLQRSYSTLVLKYLVSVDHVDARTRNCRLFTTRCQTRRFCCHV